MGIISCATQTSEGCACRPHRPLIFSFFSQDLTSSRPLWMVIQLPKYDGNSGQGPLKHVSLLLGCLFLLCTITEAQGAETFEGVLS